ncbi:MAG: hypothetical protein RLQ12_17585 [Cyclobacteriaceae bacterium]
MKPHSIIFFLGLILICTHSSFTQNTEAKRVLFLGNSVFYHRGGLGPSFEGFCRQAGLDYQAFSQRNTPANTLSIEFLDYGRIPVNLPEMAADDKIHELIRAGNFDFVILEARREGFLIPDDAVFPNRRSQAIPYEQNLRALKSLHQTIVQSGAQTVLYMHPGRHTSPDIKLAIAQIYGRFHADLEQTEISGKKHDVILVPALLLWLDALTHYGVDGWYIDESHGNALARYASACMLYTYLTGNDPRENAHNLLTEVTGSWEIIPEKAQVFAGKEDETWIKNQVWLYYSTRK